MHADSTTPLTKNCRAHKAWPCILLACVLLPACSLPARLQLPKEPRQGAVHHLDRPKRQTSALLTLCIFHLLPYGHVSCLQIPHVQPHLPNGVHERRCRQVCIIVLHLRVCLWYRATRRVTTVLFVVGLCL